MKLVGLALLILVLPVRAKPVQAGQGERGDWPFFAFCIEHDAVKRSMSEQADLLERIGYDGYGHLWLDGADARARTLEDVGLSLFQVYVKVDLAASRPFDVQALKKVLPALKPHGTQLALLVTGGKPSEPDLDGKAVEVVTRMADMARPFGVTIVLYPHTNDWLENAGDAVRVAAKVDRPGEVGVMFNLCHWMKADPNRDLGAVLRQTKPWLMAVSLSGSDSAAEVRNGKGDWIQPLGRGSGDISVFLDHLRAINYSGPIGLQCYGIGGDAKGHLEESMLVWKRLNQVE